MTDAAAPTRTPSQPPAPGGREPVGPVGRVLVGVLSFVLLVLFAAAGARLFVATDAGRAFVTRRVDGLKLGPIGRLHVEGLQGDVLSSFGVGRLTIADARGVWLDGRDLRLRWRPLELLTRRVHAERLSVGDLYVARRPELEKRPPSPPSQPPVGVRIDALAGRLRTGPALTVAAGDWPVAGGLDFRRSGRTDATLHAMSRLHAGDGLNADLRMTDKRRLSLHVDGVEAAGGALAGGLGLAAGQPFRLAADGLSGDDGGRLHVDSRSGAVRPLWADGAWTARGGGRVEAHALLAASRLTQGYLLRIGPQADAVLVAAPDVGGHVADLTVTGRLSRLHAHGPVDFGRLSTPGLQVDAATQSLAAWFRPPPLGATQVKGVLKGSVRGFTIAAQAVGEHMDEVGLEVARLTGPLNVEFARGEWRIRTNLQGEGGGGEGLLPALLGPRPTVDVDLSILKDRRLLFHALHVAGTYASAEATGAQDLFGGLSFQGSFTAPSLKGVRPGAGGEVTASWKATSPRHNQVWALSASARAARFTSGLPALDRMLGPAPALVATGTFDPAGLHISSSTLTGAAAKATAVGGLGLDKRLAFDLAWTAAGPFDAGPIEVTGAMTGKGRLTGTIGEPQADLTARLASLDFGRLVVAPAELQLSFTRGVRDVTGRVALSGPSNYGMAKATSAFDLAPDGIELSDLSADAGGVKLGGALLLRNDEPSAADLTVVAGPGAFLAAGRLSGAVRMAQAGANARATVTLDGRGLELPGSTVRVDRLALNAAGPVDQLPYRLAVSGDADAAFAWTGEGVLSKDGAGRRLTVSGSGRLRGVELRTQAPGVIGFGPDGTQAHLRLAAARGEAQVDVAQSGPAGQRRLDAHVTLAKVALGAAMEDYAGALTADLTLAGRGPALAGRLQASIAGARAADAAPDLALDGQLTAELAGDRIRGAAQATNAQGLKSRATFDLPAVAAADPFRIALVRTQALNGAFDIEGEIKPLWDLFGGGERTLAGRISAHASVAGSLDNPTTTGQAQIAKGAFEDLSTGLKLRDIALAATIGRNQMQVSTFSAGDGATGQASGVGVVSLAPSGASNLELNLKRFRVIDNELGKATASGKIEVTRDAQGHARLAGALAVDRADISAAAQSAPGVVRLDVTELHRPAGVGSTQAENSAASASRTASLIALDVSLEAARGVFVRGRGVDAELSLDAHVGGTVAAPVLTGDARLVRGSYDFSGKRFDFDQSSVVHLATRPEQIRLDLNAERDDPSLDARIRITGTAAAPVIALTSAPVLPQDEILSRVLFGVSASQLSPFEAAQLASALASLATGGGFDVLGSLRQFAGLDRLTLGGGAGSGASVSGGKYLTPNVYVELTGAGTQRGENQQQLLQTGRTGSSGSIEFRVRRNLSLVGQVWTGGDSRLSVQFRRTFGQPPRAVPRPPAPPPG